MKLTLFQRDLRAEMRVGVWYDCYVNQGSGGACLPEWFHRDQTQPFATLRPMLEAGVITGRLKEGFPQVMVNLIPDTVDESTPDER